VVEAETPASTSASGPALKRQRWLTRDSVLVTLALAVMISAWILGAPRSAGPDEPGHNIRAGALVRGQLDGESLSGIFHRGFELPAHVGFPPPNCFAFESYTPATCAADLTAPAGTAILGTRAADYPIWGHLAAGVGTLAPASIAPWSARAADAVLPMLLLAASVMLAARRGALGVGVTMLAVTPMAWFMFATVNPSGLTIAGGLAVWTALSALATVRGQVAIASDRAAAWLAAIGWAALVLPRRDGLVWGALILAMALLTMSMGGRSLAQRIGPRPLALVGASTLATLVWAAGSDTNDARSLFLTPLVPAAAMVGRRLWWKLSERTAALRWAACGSAALGGLVAMIAVMGTRTNGFDRLVLRLVIGETGTSLRQAIGVLGWLDTPVPTSVMFLCVLAIGALVGVAVLGDERQIGAGMVAVFGAGVLASWTLTMLQNNDFGVYWQGRYYLPLLVGIPVLGARLRLDPAAARRLGLAVLVAGLVVANLGLAAMMRRFAGGIAGTLVPWEWDTYGAPVPPAVMLALHLAASGVIVWWAARLASNTLPESRP
jgi:hypothetical protein